MRQALQLLRAEAADIEARGLRMSPEAAVRLHAACRAVCEPADVNVRLDLLGIPEPVGASGVHLWSLSIAAGCWLEEYAAGWWAKAPTRYFYALAFAMANARTSVFRELTDEATAWLRIRAFALGLAVYAAELEAAVDRVLGVPAGRIRTRDTEDEASGKMSGQWLELVGELEATSGIRAEEWLFGRAAQTVFAVWSRQMRIRAAMAGAKLDERSALDDAIENLARVKRDIIRKAGK